MNHLIIGNTSQLSQYFPKKNCSFISSRDIDTLSVTKESWDKIFFCFAEQRTFIESDNPLFHQVNVKNTLSLIEEMQPSANQIILYATAELWNNSTKNSISIDDAFNYNKTPYIESKRQLVDHINQNREKYPKVTILFPVNFNSIYRKKRLLVF